jgi:signal transduction histidine kinase
MPRLAHFIRENRENILAAWEDFARRLPSAGSMDVAALRDHADAMLDVIAQDLETAQSEEQRAGKAIGTLAAGSDPTRTAAAKHGLGRATSGFTVAEMLAEFRALRASVITLWRQRQEHAGPDELEEIVRFNEAIDQAIAESVAQYAREVESTRDRFLAVLGHDLRTPLGVIRTSSQFLLEATDLTAEQRTLIAGMDKSGLRMTDLVTDLLDLALTRFGDGIPIKRAELDAGTLVREAVAEVKASTRHGRIEVETKGELTGHWDKARLGQALINLVGNAVQHGRRGGEIKVVACGDERAAVEISVSNEGVPIPPEHVGGLFDAMKGGPSDQRDRRHLGLGLYIVDKIVEAHGGDIDVRSSQGAGTTFVIRLPR